MNDCTPAERSALLLYEDAVITAKQQIAGTLKFDSADDVRRIVRELTGSDEQAEDAVFRWRQDALAQGREIT